MTAIGRCKGAGPFLEYWDSFLKYNFYTSDNEKLKATASTKIFFTSMPSSNDLSSITHFAKASHRLSYHSELSIAYQAHKKDCYSNEPRIIIQEFNQF